MMMVMMKITQYFYYEEIRVDLVGFGSQELHFSQIQIKGLRLEIGSLGLNLG